MLHTLLRRLRQIFHCDPHHGWRIGRFLGRDAWFDWWLLLVVAFHGFFYHLVFWTEYAKPLATLVAFGLTLPVCLLIHEAGHLACTPQVGNAAPLRLLPIGAIRPASPDATPARAAAGGLGATFLATVAATLTAAGCSLPLLPDGRAIAPTGAVFLQYFLVWNLVILITNLVPCYPMDGGLLLRATLRRTGDDSARADLLTLGISRVAAIASVIAGLGLLVWSLGDRGVVIESPLPVYLFANLLLLAFFHFQRASDLVPSRLPAGPPAPALDEGLFGYDFSMGYTSLERTGEPGSPEPSVSIRPAVGATRPDDEESGSPARLDATTRDRVDLLLEKIHAVGVEGLTREERRFLRRASRLYRKPDEES